MMASIRHLLKMLAGFDATFLVFTLTLFCISSWSDYYNDYFRPWLTPYMLPVIQIALTGSVWTTVAVSVERYLTVCLNYRSDKIHLFYTAPILMVSFVFNVPRFFELRTVVEPHNVTRFDEITNETIITDVIEKPIVMPTDFRKDPGYSRDYVLIANSLGVVFIPIITLVVLNSLIFRTITKATQRHNAISSNQRRDYSVAMMLILIVVVFVICHSIRTIINTFECIQFSLYRELKYWPFWIKILVHVNHFALVVNSSINILIYCCKDEKFFNVLLVTIGIRSPDQRRRRGSATNRTTTGPTLATQVNGTTSTLCHSQQNLELANVNHPVNGNSNGDTGPSTNGNDKIKDVVVTAKVNGQVSSQFVTAKLSSYNLANETPKGAGAVGDEDVALLSQGSKNCSEICRVAEECCSVACSCGGGSQGSGTLSHTSSLGSECEGAAEVVAKSPDDECVVSSFRKTTTASTQTPSTIATNV